MRILENKINKLQLGNLFPNNLQNILRRIASKIIKIDKKINSIGIKYSTEEQLTGNTWINEKPIYRKIIELPPTTEDTISEYNISELNIENIIKLSGQSTDGVGTYFVNSPSSISDSVTIIELPLVSIEIEDGDTTIYYSLSTIDIPNDSVHRLGNRNIIISLEYTKTTD